MSKRGPIIEKTCIMILLLLFGGSTYFLVAAGYESFTRMNKSQDDCLNMRVATNYLSMQIRRFDVKGAVLIDDSPPGTRLVLGEDIDGERYETRIFFHNSYLRESFTSAEMPFDEEYGFEIIKLDSFNIRRENNMIDIELSNGASRRSMKLTLMSE